MAATRADHHTQHCRMAGDVWERSGCTGQSGPSPNGERGKAGEADGPSEAASTRRWPREPECPEDVVVGADGKAFAGWGTLVDDRIGRHRHGVERRLGP